MTRVAALFREVQIAIDEHREELIASTRSRVTVTTVPRW